MSGLKFPKEETKKKRMSHPASILGSRKGRCYLCSRCGQTHTVYDSEDSTYEYKPRGFEEVEYPEYPYSEVIGYTENSDGTITLTANVVFPYSGNSKVYTHEVVVRPLEDDGVQYVSNRIIPSEDNSEETWHTPRLTAEEWEELYGGE